MPTTFHVGVEAFCNCAGFRISHNNYATNGFSLVLHVPMLKIATTMHFTSKFTLATPNVRSKIRKIVPSKQDLSIKESFDSV